LGDPPNWQTIECRTNIPRRTSGAPGFLPKWRWKKRWIERVCELLRFCELHLNQVAILKKPARMIALLLRSSGNGAMQDFICKLLHIEGYCWDVRGQVFESSHLTIPFG
jgi:hypothetical protein